MNKPKTQKNTKLVLYVIVGVLVASTFLFKLINNFQLEQTSILFIGLPALITVLMIRFSGTPKSAFGIVFKVITLFLLMSSILLGEGTICIIMAAPLFYGVAAVIVLIYELLKKYNKKKFNSLIIIPLLVLVSQPLDYAIEPKIQTVETRLTVSNETNLEMFNKQPNLQNDLPSFLTIGFPKPLDVAGNGIEIGDSRNIRFESSTKGVGVLSLLVNEKSDSKVKFIVIKDETHINHWLTWKSFSVELVKSDKYQIEVIWTSEYTCDLGPNWYFEPMEAYAVNLMNEHLINLYFQ